MKKPEVYIILEELEENGSSLFDVDIQVLDESAPNEKVRYNSLEKANTAISTVFEKKYEILSVQRLIQTKEILVEKKEKTTSSEHKTSFATEIFFPTHVTYHIELDTFRTAIEQFLKLKGYDLSYTITYEELENGGKIGELLLIVDIDELSEVEMDKLETEYGDEYYIYLLDSLLKDMFQVEKIHYEINMVSELVIIQIPTFDFKQKHFL